MAVPYTFGTATAAIPLSNLDSNFATTITLGNTAIQLGNTVTTLNNMTLANATVSSLSTPITPAQGGTGLATLTANNVMLGNGTSNVAFVAPGTSGNLLASNGTTWVSQAAASTTSIANGTSNVSIATSGGNVVVATNGNTAVTYDTNQNATFAGYGNLPNTFGFKNRIINGAMVIAQRGTGTTTVTANAYYSCDRWQTLQSAASKYSVGQSSTAPAGFTKSLLLTSLSAYTVGASEQFVVRQGIEGVNTADLGWGAAGASTVTVSFWVRSSLTGAFGAALYNNGGDRSYPFSYTISSANTWEQKSITIAGDTTGTWVTDSSGAGIYVSFSLGSGSTYSGTANAWAAAYYVQPTGSTSLLATNGATLYITGVQLEKGSTATSFDYRSYGTELQLCQRYFCAFGSIGSTGTNGDVFIGSQRSTSQAWFAVQYPVPMRSTPSLTSVSTTGAQWSSASQDTSVTSWNVSNTPTPRTAFMYGGGSFTVGQTAGLMYTNGGSTTNAFYFSAEL
jgi:hypothetical protein